MTSKYKNVDLKRKRQKPFVSAFVIKRMVDTDPDLSFLRQYENYTGKDITPEEAEKYAQQDRERLERYDRGDWCMMGIRAECTFLMPSGLVDGKGNEAHIIQTLTSGGLWGIESDSEESYFKEIEDEEIAQLKEYCKTLGIRFNKNTPVKHQDY